MASVSGRRMVKREPSPGLRLHVQRAAELLDLAGDHVHADAAARQRAHRARGRETGLEHELHDVFVGQLLIGAHQAQRDALVADRLEIHAGAVVGNLDDDFRAFAMQRDGDGAALVLARLLALFGRSRCRARRRCAACARTAASCARAPGGRVRRRRPRSAARPSCACRWRPGARCARGAARGAGTAPCACA